MELTGVGLEVIEDPITPGSRMVSDIAVFSGGLAGAVDKLPSLRPDISFFIFQIFAKYMVARLNVATLQVWSQAPPVHDWKRLELHQIYDGRRHVNVFCQIANYAATDPPRESYDQ